LEQSIIASGADPIAYVTSPRWMGSVRFEAGPLRAESLQVGFDPIEDNLHHGEVWGTAPKSKQRRLMALAEWFVPIDGVTIPKGD